MLISIAVVVLLALVSDHETEAKGNAPLSADWRSFKQFHGKKYASAYHESKAKANFAKNKAAIDAHNAKFARGEVSHALELNAFADQDPVQFRNIRNGARPPPEIIERHRHHHHHHHHRTTTTVAPSSSAPPPQSSSPAPAPPPASSSVAPPPPPPPPGSSTPAPSPGSSSAAPPPGPGPAPGPAPASFDWRTQNKVSPVKDQQQCGDCWAFSAMSALEDQRLMHNLPLILLSEEELVDCDTSDYGCGGGWQVNAWTWLESHGAESDADYAYTAGNGQAGKCQYDASKVVQNVTGYQQMDMSNGRVQDTAMEAYLVQNGPLAIVVDAGPWQSYSTGVLKCDGLNQPDHAVLLVGYGTDPTYGDYWIVQNSWGEGWGENGYIQVQRQGPSGADGTDCGITHWLAAYPTIV